MNESSNESSAFVLEKHLLTLIHEEKATNARARIKLIIDIKKAITVYNVLWRWRMIIWLNLVTVFMMN